MDVGVSPTTGVTSNTHCPEQLTRNASIGVTIDDLTEGLLVVSFAHNDNLYQGVLFQLNRERGIPSGISFAKEQVLGSIGDKSEGDTTQSPPLHQRHSYNQQGSSSSSSNSCGAPYHGTISQPSLRRVIKPPARFKNARMSLRLRARPVLCAKCRSLCDDKADTSGKDELPKEESQQTDKIKKDRLKLGRKKDTNCSGVTSSSSSMNGKLRGNVAPTPSSSTCPEVAAEDLRYVGVGSTRIVENYWKRPLVQPLIPSSEETYAKLRKHKAPPPPDVKDKRKVRKPMASFDSSAGGCSGTSSRISPTPPVRSGDKFNGKASSNGASSGGVIPSASSSNSTFLKESTVCDKNFPNTRSRKALNLKMCITKLTELRRGKDTKNGGKQRSECSTTGLGPRDTPQESSSPSHSDTSSESMTVSSSNSSKQGKASLKKSKEWENRIRKKSTVPARFRDEGYLTKSIFNFNKRRPHISQSGEIPVLTICRREAANTFTVSPVPEATDVTVTTTNDDNEDVVDDDDDDNEEDDNSSTPPTLDLVPSPASPPPQEDSSSSVVGNPKSPTPSSTTSSSNLQEASPTPSLSIKSSPTKQAGEVTKTPTIKITFGSFGNGVVVQIPPKVTQHLECSSTTEMKAARKAMKKAKKEARRKRSLSGDFSPSHNELSSPPPKVERSNPPSPLSPREEPQSSVAVPPRDTESLESVPSEPIPPSSPSRIMKKKKKQKKRRRSSKVFKENDGFTSSSSSHDTGGFLLQLPSPSSNTSPLNPEYVNNNGNSSPGGTSVKSCGLDSVSNPEAHHDDLLSSFCKDACLPPRRRSSVPATSNISSSDASFPQRVCINLKRINTNAYVPLPLNAITPRSDNDDPSLHESNSGVDTDDSEPNEFPVNGTAANGNESDGSGNNASPSASVELYKDKETDWTFRKGDIIWGKLPACPWWPGKIIDILTTNSEDARAKVSWYKSTTQSCIRLKMIVPFAEFFDSKYTRSRRRGLYQLAVKDALVEAHKLNPEDLPTD